MPGVDYEHTQSPVGAHRREVAIWTFSLNGDKLTILPGAFQSLFNDKIGLKFSTRACVLCNAGWGESVVKHTSERHFNL